MVIKITLQEALNSCTDWDEFCKDMGFSVWAVNEGGGNVEVEMDAEQAKRHGIINVN